MDPATGIYQFSDKNGNPTASPDGVLDRTVLIDLAPKFYGGFQNSFIIKGFQLDFLFSLSNRLDNIICLITHILPEVLLVEGQINWSRCLIAGKTRRYCANTAIYQRLWTL